ncbi:MAG: hypothetical protein LQ337_004143 [Flavoplaca oasis]|nr:MAG: hypothetical protein LQ337_004143 [Flavoplaca oasis]
MTNPLESHVIMTEPITPDQTDGGDSEAAATDAAEEDEEELDPTEAKVLKDGGEVRDDDPTIEGLRNINSLASWTVSTHKPTCGVTALLSPAPHTYWQSDGPQPHTLTIHFFKLVHIAKLRILLDFSKDESYTPTRMQFLAGTGHHDLCEFGGWEGQQPVGWQDVPLDGCGVGGGKGLRCFLVQVRVLENHQNGKDTHVRGVQIFARDERVPQIREDESKHESDGSGMEMEEDQAPRKRGGSKGRSLFDLKGLGGLDEPDWMKDPVVR